MACYIDEEELYKCHKHPSRRRKTGICPKCLRDRLVTLCPNCATARPCACSPPPIDSASSSSSSTTSFSLFSFSRGGSHHNNHLSDNLETNPTLRKSRSVAISLFRSRSKYVGTGTGIRTDGCDVEIGINNNNSNINDNINNKVLPPKVISKGKRSLWSVFTVNNKSKKSDVHDDGTEDLYKSDNNNSMMMRSRSVAVGTGNRLTPMSAKEKGWYFPSPNNAFQYTKSPLSVTVA